MVGNSEWKHYYHDMIYPFTPKYGNITDDGSTIYIKDLKMDKIT